MSQQAEKMGESWDLGLKGLLYGTRKSCVVLWAMESHYRLLRRGGTQGLCLRKIFLAATWRLGIHRGPGSYEERQ